MSAAVQWPVVCICAVLSVANWFCKRITGAKTLLVTAAWTCACFFLPFPGAQVHPAALGCLCMWMSIFALACVLCDIKDVSFDRLRRIRSLPVAIGVQETRRFVLLLLVLIAAVAGYFAYPELALVCVALLFINQSQRILENMLWSPLCVDGTLLVLAVGYVLYRS